MNGSDCRSNPTTIGPHPEAGCRSLPIPHGGESSRRVLELHCCGGVRRQCRAGPVGVGRRFGPDVNAWGANRIGLLAAGHARSVIDLPEGVGPVHVQRGQIAIVQKGDPGRRGRDELADDGMRHA